MSESTTTELKLEYDSTIELLKDYQSKITGLEYKLSTIRKKIVDNCNHTWKYEPPAIYERGYYYCCNCGINKK